jgi:long-chain fatty acid transport protein
MLKPAFLNCPLAILSHPGRRTATAGWATAMRVLAIATPILCATHAAGQAGGVYLPEGGGPVNGTAQAGSAALARDAETAWLNPAGMTQLDAPEVLVSLMPFYLDFRFNPDSGTTATGSDGGNQGGWLPAASVYVAAPVHERVSVGFSLTSPAGLVLDPEDDWVGRNWSTKSTLVALNLEPSVGVRLGDQWSIGGGIDVQYLTFEQDLIGPGPVGVPLSIDGDSWNVGFSLSLLWKPVESTRLGLRYRSQIAHDLSGDLTVNAARPVSTSFTLPMSVTLSGYHEVSERVALLADVGWTDWSAFDNNVIVFDGTGTSTELSRNFRDTWNVSLGTHYRPRADWLLMFGAGYTSSAVSDEDRTPDLPVDEQVRAALGAEYQIDERWTVGGSYTFLWLGDNRVDQTRPLVGRVSGSYDAFAHLFGIYGSFRF